MAAADAPVIVVRRRGAKRHQGHHGGAWKVALADFVTAMMAFFLLLWLIGSTTAEQKRGISEYFQNPSAVEAAGGASTSMIEMGGAREIERGEGEYFREHQQDQPSEAVSRNASEERRQLEALKAELEIQIERNAALNAFKDQLLLDITQEGLRIQVVDKENRPMFDVGGDELKGYTKAIFQQLAQVLRNVPNKISLAGHTDARPFNRRDGYSNWELSADRANASRRELTAAGVPGDKIGRIVGLASTVLFDKRDPYNPINRRISIVVLNKAAERAMMARGEMSEDVIEASARGAVIDGDAGVRGAIRR